MSMFGYCDFNSEIILSSGSFDSGLYWSIFAYNFSYINSSIQSLISAVCVNSSHSYLISGCVFRINLIISSKLK